MSQILDPAQKYVTNFWFLYSIGVNQNLKRNI